MQSLIKTHNKFQESAMYSIHLSVWVRKFNNADWMCEPRTP